MAEFMLTAACGAGDPFRAALFEEAGSYDRSSVHELMDPGGESALFERAWYSGWKVLAEDSRVYPLRRLYANGKEIDLRSSSSQPFLMQYGLVQFQAEILDELGEKRTLWSKYCSALNSTDSENIAKMIKRIAEIEEPVKSLLCWPSRAPRDDATYQSREEERYSMLTGSTVADPGGRKGPPSVVQDIIAVYRKNAGYFRARPEYTIRKEPVPVPYHCVKKLSRDSMLWSVRSGNMQKLPVGSEKGILVGSAYYLPSETLTERSVKDYHIYENEVVIGFLDTVARELQDRTWMEQRGHDDGGFDILRMILYPDTQPVPESLSEIENLRRQYQRSLRLEERRLPRVLSLPAQTKRFQEIQPYHDIYQKICAWFRSGNTLNWGEGAIFKGRLADKIYEYYCWQELLRVFANRGFHKARASVCTGYHGKRPRPPFSNIVYLQKGQTNVTLYFDPWIPTSQRRQAPLHGITLVRTVWTPGQEGYSPDFLIKVEQAGEVSYAVLDAKFRDMQNLFRHWDADGMSSMEESLQKYYIDLSDRERLYRPVKLLWLLQGRLDAEGRTSSRPVEKGDPEARLEYYPDRYFDALAWGAVPLHPDSAAEWAVHFWRVFEESFRV